MKPPVRRGRLPQNGYVFEGGRGAGSRAPAGRRWRDGDGRAVLCQAEADARVRTVRSVVRFTYDGPAALSWRQERGDLKSAAGRWELEDLGGNRTRATYWLEVDLGRVLGLVIRGPLVDLLRAMMVDSRAGELKRAAESG